MRISIEIDECLLREAMAATGLPTAQETVVEALRRLVTEQRRRRAIEDLAGVGWAGDLDEMRRTRAED